jgi:hypothetical protein
MAVAGVLFDSYEEVMLIRRTEINTNLRILQMRR